MEELKDKVNVLILTRRYRVKGDISYFSNTRLTDYMVESKSFIAVTDADVMDLDGKILFRTPFLNIQRDSIEIITPADMVKMNG